MSEILINKDTKEKKEIPTGFSWTMLFFGIFVPLLRGYFIYFFILLALCFLGGLGIIIAWFICPFIINKHYRQHLLSNGWVTESIYMELVEEKEKKAKKEADAEMFQKVIMAKMLEK
ncbi:hypothetical protein [Edwardsiella tarda]